MKLVSFIVTYFNEPADMLEACLRSILALHLNDDEREIVLVDDGSPSPPTSIVEKMAHRLVYIRQNNEGLSSARNKGLEVASGLFIQFVDADDMLVTETYQYCLNVIKSDQRLDLVMFRFTRNIDFGDKSNNWLRCRRCHRISVCDNGAKYLSRHNLRPAAWSYLFKRERLGNLRFTPGRLHEDEEFTPLLFMRMGRVAWTCAEAYFYRPRKDSITARQDMAHIGRRLNDLELIASKLAIESNRLTGLQQRGLQRRTDQLLMAYIYQIAMLKPPPQETHAMEPTVSRLRSKGLFPLPHRLYTLKYWLFSWVTVTRPGRYFMCLCLSKQLKP